MIMQTETWNRKDGIVFKAVERNHLGQFIGRTNQTIEYAIVVRKR